MGIKNLLIKNTVGGISNIKTIHQSLKKKKKIAFNF